MQPSSRLRHVPALDGWRGVAVLAVLLFHAEVSWMPGGFLGVSAFFTLSGFLITSLLLRERDEAGGIDLRAFWARRARRLLPASFLALGFVVVYGAVAADPSQVRALGGDVLAALANVSNWRFLADGRSYEALFAAPSPVQHFWSLSIEEQCYLALPLLAAAALAGRRRPRAVLFAVLAALTIASVAASLAFADPGDTSRTYYGTDTRAAELLVGALVAVGATSARGRRALDSAAGTRIVAAAGLGALAPLLWWWATVDQSDPWLARGGLALHAVLVAAVLLAACRPTPVAAALRLRPLVALGTISYGVYLFHWPVYLWLDAERTGLAEAPLLALRLAVTLAIAIPSYALLERPIRHGRALTTGRARVALPAALLLVAGGVLAVTSDPPEPEFVLEAVSNTGPPATVPGAPDASSTTVAPAAPASDGREQQIERAAPRAPTPADRSLHRPLDEPRPVRVLVVGDSVALTLGRGLERWGQATGDAAVWNVARKYCAIGRSLERPAVVKADQGPGCDDWETRWADQVTEFDPDTVVVLSTVWELLERKAAHWDEFATPGEVRYDDWQLREYVAAVDVLSARGAQVVWLTMPCIGDPFDPGTPARIERYNDVQLTDRLAAARPATVRVLDLHGEVCPGGEFTDTIRGVPGARPDGNHFSDPGAEAVAAWLMPQLVR